MEFAGTNDKGHHQAARKMSAELQEAEEGNIRDDEGVDGGDDGDTDTRHDDGAAGRETSGAADGETNTVQDDGDGDDARRGRRRRLQLVVSACFAFLRLFARNKLRSGNFSAPWELVKQCLNATFLVVSVAILIVSVAIECLIVGGVIDEERADGILEATKCAMAPVVLLVVLWILLS